MQCDSIEPNRTVSSFSRTAILRLFCLILVAVIVINTFKAKGMVGIDNEREFANPGLAAAKSHFYRMTKWLNAAGVYQDKGVNASVPIQSEKLRYLQCHKDFVNLQPLRSGDVEWANEDGENNKMFMVETSGSPKLSPKTACAMESAVRVTGLSILVMVFSTYLDLRDSTTCQLYNLSFERQIQFYRILPEEDLKETPLHDLSTRGLFNSSNHSTVHLSDALRLAYVEKYGGWYADTDFVFIKSMLDMRNIIMLTALSQKDETRKSFHVSNAVFNADKRHVMLQRYMEKFSRSFKGKGRAEVGPMLLTRTIRELCHLPGSKLLIKLNDPQICHGITARHPDGFHPFRPYAAGKMWSHKQDRTPEYWESWIKADTLAVHFFGGLSGNRSASHDPKKDIYSYLAPQYCPMSYYSAEKFV